MKSEGELEAPPAGSGAEPQPRSNLVDFNEHNMTSASNRLSNDMKIIDLG